MGIKRFLTLALIFAISSITNATVIDTVINGNGSKGHAGTIDDPLEEWEFIEIKLVLNHNPYPGFPSYDGYLLSSMETMLNVSGSGSLCKKDGKNPWTEIPDNEIPLYGVYLTPLRGPADVPLSEEPIWPGTELQLGILAVGTGMITLDLNTISMSGEYAPFSDMTGENPYPDPPGWIELVNENIGDLPLYVALTGDTDNDWDVDLADFSDFAIQWRMTGCGQCAGADLTGDGNVDEADLRKFVANWLIIAEPTIFYQVGLCDEQAQPPGDPVRFIVTVQGHFLLFEDLIEANCDSDEIDLQMVVSENNRITIYETELTPDPGWQCNHPTNATLLTFE